MCAAMATSAVEGAQLASRPSPANGPGRARQLRHGRWRHHARFSPNGPDFCGLYLVGLMDRGHGLGRSTMSRQPFVQIVWRDLPCVPVVANRPYPARKRPHDGGSTDTG